LFSFTDFPNRTHHTVGQSGWEEVADHAIEWATKHAKTDVTLADVRQAFSAERDYTTPTSADIRI